jgi:putative membrane protein insertion efficiency factor
LRKVREAVTIARLRQAALLIDDERLPAPGELRRLLRAERRAHEGPLTRPPSPLARALVALIGVYRGRISPRLRSRCVFEPSCSRYAELAIAHTGAIRGSLATATRLARCRPANEGQVDYPKGISCRTR